jgi:hypothetical protein
MIRMHAANSRDVRSRYGRQSTPGRRFAQGSDEIRVLSRTGIRRAALLNVKKDAMTTSRGENDADA